MKRTALRLLAVSSSLLVAGPASAGDLPHAPGSLLTGATDELFGGFVASAGDVDGDGLGDVVVAAVSDDGPPFGVARVFAGDDGRELYSFAHPGVATFFGEPVRGAGDLDGDGFGEVLVGSPLTDTVHVLAGPDGHVRHVIHGPTAGAGFGNSVAPAGDVDGDGRPDIVVGVDGKSGGGAAYVYSGLTGAPLLRVGHADLGDRLGFSVGGLGDVDGDGLGDLVLGAPGEGRDVLHPGFPPFVPPFRTDDGAGGVRVVSGRDGSVIWSAVGRRPGDGLGWSVAPVADQDGDGITDVLVGTETIEEPPAVGYAEVRSGATGRLVRRLPAGAPGEPAAFVQVSSAGDVDADGTHDVLVAARASGPHPVAVRLTSGATGAALFTWTPAAPFLSGRIGAAGLGDVDGDGVDDFAVADQQNVLGGGYALVFLSDAR